MVLAGQCSQSVLIVEEEITLKIRSRPPLLKDRNKFQPFKARMADQIEEIPLAGICQIDTLSG